MPWPSLAPWISCSERLTDDLPKRRWRGLRVKWLSILQTKSQSAVMACLSIVQQEHRLMSVADSEAVIAELIWAWLSHRRA